jgi:hemerythrin
MASIIWNTELNPTVDLINIHFKKIEECITCINMDIADEQGSCEHTSDLINQLEQLCQLHFIYEEQLLEGLSYPLVSELRARHKSFLESFIPFKTESDQCHSSSFMKDFIDVRLGLVSSINNDTMKLCDFIMSSYS